LIDVIWLKFYVTIDAANH